MRFIFITVILIGLAGCGPLFTPMVPRLNPQEQRQVDQIWDNILTPVQRADHQTLLDANVAYWLYTLGVDRMHMTSEKYFSAGTARMEIDCDRANPDADQFTITILDLQGRTLRRERYTRAEVEESAHMLLGAETHASLEIGPPSTEPSTQPATQPATSSTIQPSTSPATQPATQAATTPSLTPEEQQYHLEAERRQAAVAAATQPARLVSPKHH